MEIRSAKKSSHIYGSKILGPSLILSILFCAVKSASTSDNNGARPEKTLLQVFSRSFDPSITNVSSDCQKDAAIYRDALVTYEPWALQMYDASTKISAGIATGNTKQLGNYDECLRIRSDHGFAGKACSIQIQFLITARTSGEKPEVDDLDMADLLVKMSLASGLINWTSGTSVQYEWLWCVPSSCSPRDIVETIEKDLDVLRQSPRVDFTIKVGNDSCHTEETDRPIFDVADWLYIFVLILAGTLVIISTTYDLIKVRSSKKPDPEDRKRAIFTLFSAYTNGKGLFNTQRSVGAVACLDGLRFLSICWIIFCHNYYVRATGANLDLLDLAKMHESWDTLLVLNGNIVTDTFFLLGGFLLATSELVRKEKNFDRHKFNIFNLYIRRYLRLTPAYAIVIGFYATLFYKLGNGPNWNTWVGENQNNCRNNWWLNLLYINNYINVHTMCISQSWYLSTDMQLVWISPIFLYPMLANGKRKQLIFLTVLITGLIVSIITPLLITYYNNLTGTMLYYKNQTDLGNYYLQIYTKVYNRAGPYVLGLGLGYLLRKFKPSNTSMPNHFVFVGWALAIAAGLAVVFGPQAMHSPQHDYSNIEAAFYAGLHRPVFALTVGWIIIASHFNCAGPVGGLLSWSFWVPLSKLTYSIYLTHFIILLYNSGIERTPGYLTTFSVVQSFCGTLITTLFISIILSLTFEIPFVRLSNMLVNIVPRRLSLQSMNYNKSTISAFETTESCLDIYRPMDDSSASTVSRTYQDLIDRYGRVSVESFERPELSQGTENSSLSGPSRRTDFDDVRLEHDVVIESKTNGTSNERDSRSGYDNSAFEKTS